jgi:anti-sigma regulatory factor (Ser/Thr protein kinase)
MTVTVQIPSRLDHVRLVRAALWSVLEHWRVVEADILALELAVTEIVNNSIEHGYAGEPDGQVKIDIQISGMDVRISVIDHAQAFPDDQRYRISDGPAELQDPDDEWPLRGHGIQIVHQIVDSMEMSSDASGNTVSLVKRVTVGAD